jgi:ADP-heptose:LPS heptosyltransferase
MERILVLNVSGIGDFADSLPALRRLRAAKPGAFIRLVVAEKSAPLARCCPDLDDVVGLPTTPGRAIPAPVDGPRWIRRMFGLRDRYDLVLDLYGGDSLAGRSWRAWLRLMLRAPLIGPDDHCASDSQSERYLKLVSKLNPSFRPVHLSTDRPLRISDAVKREVRDWLDTLSWGPLAGPRLVVALGGDRRSRHESPERADRWLTLLQTQWRVRPILIGTRHDPALPACTRVQHVDARGQWDLVRTAALIESSDALVSTNSSPAHLAAIWGVPSIMLVGPGDAVVDRPPFSEATIRQLRHEVPCAPCYYDRCPLKGADHQRCMTGIVPEAVALAFGELMTSGRTAVGD